MMHTDKRLADLDGRLFFYQKRTKTHQYDPAKNKRAWGYTMWLLKRDSFVCFSLSLSLYLMYCLHHVTSEKEGVHTMWLPTVFCRILHSSLSVMPPSLFEKPSTQPSKAIAFKSHAFRSFDKKTVQPLFIETEIALRNISIGGIHIKEQKVVLGFELQENISAHIFQKVVLST